MTCGPVPTLFRILDRDSEWALDLAADPKRLGAVVGDTIELAQLDLLAIDPSAIDAAMPPRWIARGCAPCSWYLASPPSCGAPSVLSMTPRLLDPEAPASCDPCAPAPEDDPSCLGWVPIAGRGCHIELVDPVAVAATRDRVAILDAGRCELLVLSASGERVIASWPTRARGPIAFAGGALLVANDSELVAYDLTTLDVHQLADAPGPIARLAVAAGAAWAAITNAGALDLVRLVDGAWQPGKLADLIATAPPTGIASSGDGSLCLEIPHGGAAPRRACFDRCGQSVAPPVASPPPHRNNAGDVVTADLIDSGISRCRWHRVRIDLALPDHAGLAISLVTVDDLGAPIAEADWQTVEAARVMPAGATTCDFLIDQPPGRYLALRLGLRGDGQATPSIRRIRIDFPRSTSAERMPGVYREDPIATDFLERFVATFDASVEDLDRAIARFPALIDPAGAPAEALGWLGTFLDLALDPAWSEDTRRAILGAAPELYRRRGTPWALGRAIALVTGTSPAIQELGGASPFARLARVHPTPAAKSRCGEVIAQPASLGFRLGDSRLFGRARARVRLGASALGSAPLRSYGDPDRDHVAALGWRIVVQVPGGLLAGDAITRLRQLVDSQKPAHVAAAIRVGGDLALLGIESAVGIDTRLGGLPLPFLGTNTRLRRRTVLARGSHRGGADLAVGIASAIAIQTVLS